MLLSSLLTLKIEQVVLWMLQFYFFGGAGGGDGREGGIHMIQD